MFKVEANLKTGEEIYKKTLANGLKVYICKKPGYIKKVGMYGTVYGSIDNDFIDITTGERLKVEDGIAHFLEHKLFEQEDANALDVFAKMGVSSNAYTSFDHTVYFYETSSKHEECLNKLLEFVNTPYFTDENVEKEKGIIAQELKMYEDEPSSVAYYNVLRAMYQKFPLNVDIGGTVESVYRIDKEALYSCYNTFYNPANMFVIVIGDVDEVETVKQIESFFNENVNRKTGTVERFILEEPKEIAEKRIEKKLDVYMPYICMGFKHDKQDGKANARNTVIMELIDDICFSALSDFHERMFNSKIITEPVEITYESGKEFAHTILFAVSKKHEECEKEITKYFETLRQNGVDSELFEIAKKKKQGELIYDAENFMGIHRTVIDSIIQDTDVFEMANVIKDITKEEVDTFIKENLREDNMVISKVTEKNK